MCLGGQKNGPPKFSCIIDPKGPLNKKSENEGKNLADDGIRNIPTCTFRHACQILSQPVNQQMQLPLG